MHTWLTFMFNIGNFSCKLTENNKAISTKSNPNVLEHSTKGS